MVLAAMDRLTGDEPGTIVVKILASQAPTTLASVVGELFRVTKRRTPIVLGFSPNARFQTRDLRFRSVVWPELDQLTMTTLSAGIADTYADVAASLHRPEKAR
jgi:UDP-glucose 4-epimerase